MIKVSLNTSAILDLEAPRARKIPLPWFSTTEI